MSNGSLGTRGWEASFSISLCLSFPSWLAEVAFAGGVSQVVFIALGRHFPDTLGLWDASLGRGAVTPSKGRFSQPKALPCAPVAAPFPRVTSSGPFPSPSNRIAPRPAASLV